MDIPGLSVGMSQAALGQAVGIRVLSLAKDQAVQEGNDLVQMMMQSVQPHLGQNLDIKI